MAARKIAISLSSAEQQNLFLSIAEAVAGAFGSVQTGDVAILIAKGGNTDEIAAMIAALKENRVPIEGVTAVSNEEG